MSPDERQWETTNILARGNVALLSLQVMMGYSHSLVIARQDTEQEKERLKKLPEYNPRTIWYSVIGSPLTADSNICHEGLGRVFMSEEYSPISDTSKSFLRRFECWPPIAVKGYNCLLSALTEATRFFSALVTIVNWAFSYPTFFFFSLLQCWNLCISRFLGATARPSGNWDVKWPILHICAFFYLIPRIWNVFSFLLSLLECLWQNNLWDKWVQLPQITITAWVLLTWCIPSRCYIPFFFYGLQCSEGLPTDKLPSPVCSFCW